MLTTLTTAKLHLHVDGADEDALITAQIEAAETMAMHFLGRSVYADQAALSAAIAAAPGLLSAATADYDAATAAAALIDNDIEREAALAAAENAYAAAQGDARRARAGMVVNGSFAAAVLLTVGALFADREDPQLPKAAEWLLQPHRAY